MQPKEKIIHHEVPGKTWELVGADIFTLHNKIYLHIVDYQSKFSVIQKMEDLSAESLILACKIIFFQNMVYQRTYCQMQVVILF